MQKVGGIDSPEPGIVLFFWLETHGKNVIFIVILKHAKLKLKTQRQGVNIFKNETVQGTCNCNLFTMSKPRRCYELMYMC